MSTWAVLGALLAADVRERTRRSSFLATLGLVGALGYAVGAGHILIRLGAYRGLYSSAWVGGLMALVITFLLGLFGFYLVKGAIARDEQTGVGQILATTPLSRAQYVLGKWLSNLAVLALIVAILAGAALLIQLLLGEDRHVQLWPLLAPFLLIALPMMALVAALAVLFETVSWLRGGFGNVVYAVLYCALFGVGVQTQSPWLDAAGITLLGSSMKAAARSVYPDYAGGFTLSMASDKPLATFVWPGLDWTGAVLLQRGLWLALAVGLVLLSARLFQRFDPTRQRAGGRQPHPPVTAVGVSPEPTETTGEPATQVMLTPLAPSRRFQRNLARLVWLEALLLVKGAPWYWLLGMGGLWLGGVAAPSADTRSLWLMLAALWPLLLWSQLGCRDARCRTEALVGHTPLPLVRALGASWLAGALLATVALSGIVLGRVIWGEPLALLPWALAVLFIPTLALALGVWSRGSKLFEVVYLVLWYLGPFNTGSPLAALDYLGVHAEAPVHTAPLGVAGVIVVLLALAVVGRRRQLLG
ncbi:MAG: ABC transporter permease subunit [Chloroflexales bacterium]|nr:ABC transporter permease subunit [Chloroflexales bacterium]